MKQSDRPSTLAARAFIVARGRWRWHEAVFWLGALASYFLFPGHLLLATQVLTSGLFALSLDLLLGFAGVPSLGHAAFFGVGAYAAGLLALSGWTEPFSGLLAGAVAAGLLGLLCSLILARLSGIALITVTLGIGLLLYELANRWRGLTGGDDGLQGITIAPIGGLLEFDLFGRTAFFYAFTVSLILYLMVRRLVFSPFGLALQAIRENVRRVPALGIPLRLRMVTVFTLSAAIAGIAGALLTQTTQFVALEVLSFDRSMAVLIMLVLGGLGRLTGGLYGAAIYLVARDWLASMDPVYWNFWLGLILFVMVALGGGGALGLVDRIWRRGR